MKKPPKNRACGFPRTRLKPLISEREGSRIGIRLFNTRKVFHRPHPSPNTDKGAVVSIREWLKENKVAPK